MKITYYILTLVIATVSLLGMEVALDFFTSKSSGSDITLEWRSQNERQVARYEIERSSDNQNFRTVASLDARGMNTAYQYVDRDVLLKNGDEKNTVQKNNYFYRLRMVGTDNSVVYSNTTSVTHQVSSVRRTWGMIKEMFR